MSTPERHERIGELFEAALDQPHEMREAFLQQACMDDLELRKAVERLLQNHSESDTFLDPQLARTHAQTLLQALGSDLAQGTVIGPYRLLRQLGEGGMGTVYLAHQTHPIRRDVALKVIRLGMDTKSVIARFESERRALALMDHPNIAQVFDAGATDRGLPYFAMELVDGVPIHDYCRTQKLGIRERIELFIPVCQAIQHAHQKGIIHRDIKPSNVLVKVSEGKPIPKVIDFGLAKALGSELSGATLMTNIGTIVGTLQYMSPEQAGTGGQDIDTRSDVFSLGALLYELLTGSPPLDANRIAKDNYLAILQRIREEEPQSPNARLRESIEFKQGKALDSELDWIPLKALEKERSRRYETVNGLVLDLQRYLAGEPVEAAPPSRTYRIGKFVRKHRPWIAAAAAFALVLIAGIAVSTWMAVRATRAEQESRAINEFLQLDVLGQADPGNQSGPGGKADALLTVRTALDRAAAKLDGKFSQQPLVEGSLRHTIGSAYWSLGVLPQAQTHLEAAVKLRNTALGEAPPTLQSQSALGGLLWQAGKNAEAVPLLTGVLAAQRRTLGSANRETLLTLKTLATAYQTVNSMDKAEALWIEGEKLARETFGPEDLLALDFSLGLGNYFYLTGRYNEAQPLMSRPVEIFRRKLGEDHPNTLSATSNLAMTYWPLGQSELAEPLYERSLASCRRLYGNAHPETLVAMYNLALTRVDLGKYAEAEALYQENYSNRVLIYKPDHPRTLLFLTSWADAATMRGDYAKADALYAQFMPIARRTLGETHITTLTGYGGLAELRRRQGRLVEAESILMMLLQKDRDSFALQDMVSLAQVRVQLGKYTEAMGDAQSAYQGFTKSDPENWERFHAQSLLGASLVGLRKFAAAEPALVEGYEGMLQRKSRIRVPARSVLAEAGQRLVDFYQSQGKPDKATEWKRKLAATQR